MAELNDPFGAGQIAQCVGAEVGERDIGWQLIDDEGLDSTRDEGLAAVAEIAQPRGAVDGRADVVAFVA